MLTELRRNLDDVRGRIEAARARSPHGAERVALVVVTKAAPVDLFPVLARSDLTDVGENRVQEAAKRRPLGSARWRWHGIGHLQRNKAAAAVRTFDVFHALDSLRLARRLETILAADGRRWPVYMEVNTAGDPAKHGFAPEEALDAAKAVADLHHLDLRGFMMMAALDAGEARTRQGFRALRQIRDDAVAGGIGDAPPSGLSMGMSADYEWAVEEGATVVRVGTAIFRGVLDAAPSPGQDVPPEGSHR
ncbi:MAG: YggS family pyridoxal phosphate-dependent enzyme [Planctomycetota bacterium]